MSEKILQYPKAVLLIGAALNIIVAIVTEVQTQMIGYQINYILAGVLLGMCIMKSVDDLDAASQ